MPVKQSARTQVIKDEINRQVNDVNAIIKDLLAKKISEMKAQNPEGQQREQEQTADYGQLYNSVVEALDNLKTDLVNAPSTETVRQVKLMLNDIVKKFKGMSSSSVKAILDQIYNFIPFTKISKTETGKFTHGDDNYQGTKKGASNKNAEIRRLIRDLLIKFVHDNSVRYLHADLYPESYEEAKEYFNIEDAINNQSMVETKHKEKRMFEKEQKTDRYKAIKAKEAKDAQFKIYSQELIKHFEYNPVMYVEFLGLKSVFNTLARYGDDTSALEDVGKDADYISVLNEDRKAKLSKIVESDAVDEVAINLDHLSEPEKTSLKTRLRGKSDIFNFLISEVNPQTASEFYNVLKIAPDPKLRKQLANKL
jgi:hypothetical protein